MKTKANYLHAVLTTRYPTLEAIVCAQVQHETRCVNIMKLTNCSHAAASMLILQYDYDFLYRFIACGVVNIEGGKLVGVVPVAGYESLTSKLKLDR